MNKKVGISAVYSFLSYHFQRTLLCRLMVYSRDTTSAMAERVFLPVWTLDISI